jgi:DNA-binding response OmpR family regulator
VSSTKNGPVRILVYSDNAAVREEVINAIGDSIGATHRPIEWTQVATHQMVMIKCLEQHYNLVILDNEATKLGGVGLVRQMRAELPQKPVTLLLLARQQDAWLAAWSGTNAALLRPLDPFALIAQVEQLISA